MNRITEKDLERQIKIINQILKRPPTPYVKLVIAGTAGFVPQIGNFHLSHQNGGVALLEMANESGGCNNVFGYHMPKRDLYLCLTSFVKGLEARS